MGNANQLPSDLPHECVAIVKDADTVIDSMEQLYNGVFLNNRRKKYWVVRETKCNCFFLYARDLSISLGERKFFWRWRYIKETSDVMVDIAESIRICPLKITGKFDISKLTPNTMYEVVFVVMLNFRTYGWRVPIKLTLEQPGEEKKERTETLMNKPRSKWFEIRVGKFTVPSDQGGSLEFSLCGSDGDPGKKGLLVKGAAIRVAASDMN